MKRKFWIDIIVLLGLYVLYVFLAVVLWKNALAWYSSDCMLRFVLFVGFSIPSITILVFCRGFGICHEFYTNHLEETEENFNDFLNELKQKVRKENETSD